MEKTYNDIVAENQALKNENSILKREMKIWRKFMVSHFPEYLDVLMLYVKRAKTARKP